MTLTPEQIETYRKRLTQERLRILHTIEGLREELGTSLSDETEENGLETHIGDVATMTFLRERDFSIEENEAHLLEEIDAALARIRKGTYGVCVDSGEPIPTERLDAIPWAARTVSRQEASGL